MSQNILSNDSNLKQNMKNEQSSMSNETGTFQSESNNSKLMKGILLGGVIGGLVAMLDSNTRSKVKGTAVNVKDTSLNVISEVKNNPTEVKDQMISSFKEASAVLKEAISDAQSLYERLNTDVFSKMNDVKQLSSEAMSTATEAKEGLVEIGSKVKEAGTNVMDNPVVHAASSTPPSSDPTNHTADAYSTGMDSQPADTPGLGNTANTFVIPPSDQNNNNGR